MQEQVRAEPAGTGAAARSGDADGGAAQRDPARLKPLAASSPFTVEGRAASKLASVASAPVRSADHAGAGANRAQAASQTVARRRTLPIASPPASQPPCPGRPGEDWTSSPNPQSGPCLDDIFGGSRRKGRRGLLARFLKRLWEVFARSAPPHAGYLDWPQPNSCAVPVFARSPQLRWDCGGTWAAFPQFGIIGLANVSHRNRRILSRP